VALSILEEGKPVSAAISFTERWLAARQIACDEFRCNSSTRLPPE